MKGLILAGGRKLTLATLKPGFAKSHNAAFRQANNLLSAGYPHASRH